MTKKLLYIAAVVMLSQADAGHGNAAERFAGDFLMLGAGARNLGRGSAAVAVVDDATSGYYNSAGLVHLAARQVNLMHSEQFGGLENYNTLAFGAPLDEHAAFGVSLVHLGVGDIKYTRLWDPSTSLSDSNRVEIASREDAADYAFYLSGARRFGGRFRAGMSVKVIRRSVGDDTAFGYGIDAGMQYDLNDHWVLGVNARDVTGTTIAWDGHGNDRIAATLDAGIATHGRLPLLGGPYVLSGSMLFFGDSPDVKGLDTLHLGFEYVIHDFLAVRAGVDESNGTFGVGLMRLPLIESSSLDYAFLSHEDLDSTHRLSLTVGF